MVRSTSEFRSVRRRTPAGLRGLLRSPFQLGVLALLLVLALVALRNILPINGAAEYTANQFVRQLIFGLAQGSIYALIALGYSLCYSVLSTINFAHGEVFMAGAYAGVFAVSATQEIGLLESNPFAALLVVALAGMVASGVVALLLERVIYRPLRGGSRLVLLIAAIGASITLQQLFTRLFGANARRFPDVSLFALPGVCPTLGNQGFDASGVCRGIDLISGYYNVNLFGLDIRVLPIHFIVIISALILMAGFWFLLMHTSLGRSIRAVAEDRRAAALMGLDINRVIAFAFLFSGLLAGAGGILFSLYNPQVTPFIGFLPGLKAFTAAVLGGIGYIPGAMLGGLLIGVIESVVPSMLGMSPQLRDVIIFGILALVLLLRPQGIFGEARAETRE
jgi:branched-chain amino acid transport system permease protein